ncbi:MAG TPA: PEPxxWA-CTERM sorting domain-containing protein [Phenylobacterium sp.]|nr:PEPxxWA-CTERM sorting domain-containing protein [Phenylobacterium sp.]
MRKIALAAALTVALMGLPVAATAAIVNVDAHLTGCVSASTCGGQHYGPGIYIGDLYSPAQLTLDAGTYTITNAAGQAGANPAFDAWNFNSGSDQNWVWAFIMVDDANKVILLDSIPYGTTPFIGSHAAAAASGAGYSASFTLAATTTLDFITEDYGPYDNLGGVALRVEPDSGPVGAVPEPASWASMIAGFGLAGATLRRRSTVKA